MKKIQSFFFMFALILTSITGQSQNNVILPFKDGKEVLTQIYNAYKPNKWYRHFTFSQETYFYKDGKIDKKEIWHESSSSPGKLLIKFNTKDSKDGVIFKDNRVYVFKEGKEVANKPSVHELTLAAFDIYFIKPERSIFLLDSLGFDLKKVRYDQLDGKTMIVIGADKGDTLSNQLWYDEAHLYLRKMNFKHGNELREVELTDYKTIEKKHVATRVIFKINSTLAMEEKYFDIKFLKTEPTEYYDPKKFPELKLK